MSKISNMWNKMIQRHRQHIDSAVSRTQTGKTKGAPDMYFLKVTQHVILFWSKLIHCSLARSVYLPHAYTEAPAFFSVCPIVTDKNARAVLPHLARLPFPASLRSLSSSTPSLLLYFFFFASVFHLFGLLASPLPLNHILRLSFHTLAHTLQHNGYWCGI